MEGVCENIKTPYIKFGSVKVKWDHDVIRRTDVLGDEEKIKYWYDGNGVDYFTVIKKTPVGY